VPAVLSIAGVVYEGHVHDKVPSLQSSSQRHSFEGCGSLFHQVIKCLPAGVVDLTEEIGIIVLGGVSVLSEPQGEDEEVSSEEDSEETDVVDAEPFVGSLGRQGGGGGDDGGHDTGGDGRHGLHDIRLGGGLEGRSRDNCGRENMQKEG